MNMKAWTTQARINSRVPRLLSFGTTIGKQAKLIRPKAIKAEVRLLAAKMGVSKIVTLKPSTKTIIPSSAVVVHPRGVMVVTPSKIDVIEVWKPFVVLAGTSVFLAKRGSATDVDNPTKTVEVRFPTEAHMPLYTESDLLHDIIVRHHRGLAVCRLPSARVMALQMSDAGFGCIGCGKNFETIQKWANHFDKPVTTKLPWYAVNIVCGEIVYKCEEGILNPKRYTKNEKTPHLQSRTMLCPKYKTMLQQHAKLVISDPTPKCLKQP